MAVLVRSGRASIPGLRRALTAAGVPVEVAGDETPLVREPAVAVLLSALELLVTDDVPRDRIEELLISPLGGLDATEVRALSRALRAVHPEVGPRELVRRAVLDPALLDGVERTTRRPGAGAGAAVGACSRRPRRGRLGRAGALDAVERDLVG